jgi:hypothetical protein
MREPQSHHQQNDSDGQPRNSAPSVCSVIGISYRSKDTIVEIRSPQPILPFICAKNNQRFTLFLPFLMASRRACMYTAPDSRGASSFCADGSAAADRVYINRKATRPPS